MNAAALFLEGGDFGEFGGGEVTGEIALEVGYGVGADSGVFVEVGVVDYF